MGRLTGSFLLLLSYAAAQTPSPDTLAVLSEIRQVRNHLETAAATIQRTQIVMYRMQLQAAAVDRATQRATDARNACEQAEQQRDSLTVQLDHTDGLDAPTVARFKAMLEQIATAQPKLEAERAEAEGQLRTEQAKMSDLDEQLDQLDKVLGGYGGK